MGVIFGKKWIVAKWGRDFILEQKPSIEFLELYALVAAVITRGSHLKNIRMIVFCDNKAVLHMINNMTSKCKQCMKLIRILTLDGLLNNRRVFVRHVKTDKNILADSLSRMDFKRFWKHAHQSTNQFPDTIHQDIRPIEKIWFGNM